MQVLRDKAALRAWQAAYPVATSAPRVLVPTMGALHEGHLSLMDRAREIAGDSGTVIVTIFVNPTQFGPGEDFDAYPRTLEDDLEKCRARGVDAVFAPEVEEMYPDDASISITESRLSKGLCGAGRPGHFDGVCTVVAKLFLLLQPSSAVFGEKDYQQLAVIRRLVRDLDIPVAVVGASLVREADGLAMSSRNVYLSEDERRRALSLSQGLQAAKGLLQEGERRATMLVQAVEAVMRAAGGVQIEYVACVHPQTLEPLGEVENESGCVMALAARVGTTRLIDNLIWAPEPEAE